MSITFLQEQNGYKEIADVWWVGQTITLEVTTNVYYFYFEGYYGLDRNPIYCDVYLTDDAHHPVGSPVASAKCILHRWEKHQVRHRRRFSFYDFIMEAGIEHFFLIYDKTPTWKVNTRIYIRTGDSIYEDGMLYYSTNSGDDWTEYPNDDLIFALTGTPEVPPPPPEAPVDNFAILDLEQEVTATGIKITVTTSVPCHLYCYWTDHEPQKHLIPILTRGIELHTQLQYCFVDWHENEQEEDFDTLTHTFTKEPWAHCETRWLTFRAKVMDEWVKSVGPIFKKHRVYVGPPPVFVFEYFDGDYQYKRYIGDVNWGGQTFTPQSAHHITKVKLLLYKSGTPGDFHIEIYATSASKPTGPILCSGSVPSGTISEEPNFAWKYIELGVGCDLAVDVEYAIVAHCSSIYFPWHNVVWGMAKVMPYYPRGDSIVSGNSGTDWTIYADHDSNFYEYGYFL